MAEPDTAPHETEKPAYHSKAEAVTAPVGSQGAAGTVRADTSCNSAAVLLAWQSGDTSSLGGKINLSVYNASKDVIEQKITAGMSDYEKSLPSMIGSHDGAASA